MLCLSVWALACRVIHISLVGIQNNDVTGVGIKATPLNILILCDPSGQEELQLFLSSSPNATQHNFHALTTLLYLPLCPHLSTLCLLNLYNIYLLIPGLCFCVARVFL